MGEPWEVTKRITRKLQAFINRCCRKVFKIFWHNQIENCGSMHKRN